MHPDRHDLTVSEKERFTVSKDDRIRWNWLKGMCIYTIIGAGGFGLGMLARPELIRSMFAWPSQDPVNLGIVGSVYLAFGLLSILGLRSPLKFSPVLLLQLTYKAVWFIGVIIPMLVTGRLPAYAVPTAVIFSTYIIGDLIAIPFSYIFAKESDQ